MRCKECNKFTWFQKCQCADIKEIKRTEWMHTNRSGGRPAQPPTSHPMKSPSYGNNSNVNRESDGMDHLTSLMMLGMMINDNQESNHSHHDYGASDYGSSYDSGGSSDSGGCDCGGGD